VNVTLVKERLLIMPSNVQRKLKPSTVKKNTAPDMERSMALFGINFKALQIKKWVSGSMNAMRRQIYAAGSTRVET
jgi:hypothetical protein